MRNPIRNALYSLCHDPLHVLFAVLRRIPWIISDDVKYLKIFYFLSMHKKLDLISPKTFNEKLQWLKLYDKRDFYTKLSDKITAKEYVSNIIGNEYVVPLLGVWNSFDEIDFEGLPDKFVLKTNHDGGCNGIVICKNKSILDIKKSRKEIERSLSRNTFLIGREWSYKNIKRRVFAEKYIEDSRGETNDYKFFCFDGNIQLIEVATERNSHTGTKFDYFDKNFNYLEIDQGHPHSSKKIVKPVSFDKMIELASLLSVGIPHVRIDFYNIDGHPYFGEFTFYDSGGCGAFNPPEWDYVLGSYIELPVVTGNNQDCVG